MLSDPAGGNAASKLRLEEGGGAQLCGGNVGTLHKQGQSSQLLCPPQNVGQVLNDISIDHFAEKPWNRRNEVFITDWLCQVRTAEDECRLHQLGNIVVPCQAYIAMLILGRLMACLEES